MKSIIAKIKAFFTKLFGKKAAKAVAPSAPVPLVGAALAVELNKQSNPTEQANTVLVPVAKKVKTTKKVTKKTSKKKA